MTAPEHDAAGFGIAHVCAEDEPGEFALALELCNQNAILSNSILELPVTHERHAYA